MYIGNPLPERCQDLWFEDGTIVIEVNRRNHESRVYVPVIQFRVYRGVLQQYSDGILNFGGMESIVVDRKVDGCPIVPLYDDDPVQVALLLRLLHKLDFFSTWSTSEPSDLPGLCQLSLKYQIPIVQKLCAERLEKAFPNNLNAWNARDTSFDNNCLDFLRFAMEANITHLQPALMYVCATYNPPASLGSSPSLIESTTQPSPEIIHALLGRARILTWLMGNCGKCCGNRTVYVPGLESVSNVSFIFASGAFGPLHFKNDMVPACSYPPCEDCVKRHGGEGRKLAWELLPIWFGFEDWAAVN